MTIPSYNCQICGRHAHEMFRPALRLRPCKCGNNHWTCRACWKEHTKVIGEFPTWGVKLNLCPIERENDGKETQR